ncbi:hydroxyacid dehydrogenase [Streptomyces sp. UG1]|uniref:hydroxyacid dehydrogenase n=1 Tax=Streptomyces sp. UG1 TaxID=3417652 RepID=UPI003CEFA8A6
MSRRPTAMFAMDAPNLPQLFPPDLLARLRELLDIDPAGVVTDFGDPALRSRLARVEVLVTGWGCPPLDCHALDALPRLHTVLHTGGTVKRLLPPEGRARGLTVSSAAAQNALPVAEYTLGMILLLGKGVFAAQEDRRAAWHRLPDLARSDIGNMGRRVGLIGASAVGRRVIELLRPFDFDVVLYDPYVDAAAARSLGVRKSGLEDLLADSSIVSVHAPATPETRHMIDAGRLALLPDGSALINTARGSLVDTEALVRELATGRIRAVLDVTDPEPLPVDSPLFDLPNVILTPHIAGSQGNELRRLGAAVVAEAERLRMGAPLAQRVEVAHLDRTA